MPPASMGGASEIRNNLYKISLIFNVGKGKFVSI